MALLISREVQIEQSHKKVELYCSEHEAGKKINLVIAYSDSTLVKNTSTYVHEEKNI